VTQAFWIAKPILYIYILPQPSFKQPIKDWTVIGPEDIAVIDLDGKVVGNPENLPTIEAPMHIRIYKVRPDVNAIVHSHGEWSQIFAGVRKDIPVFIEDTYLALGGEIKCAEFGREASEELAENLLKALGRYNKAALMAGHGAACVGNSLDEAFFVAEIVERSARQAIYAYQIGEPVPITVSTIIDPEKAKTGGGLPQRAMGMNIPDELIKKLGQE
jgi:L-fuculose-phosphate aldolase